MDNFSFAQTPLEEQETIITIDYHDKKVNVYSTKKSVCTKMKKYFGEPNNITFLKNKISSCDYNLDMSNPNLKKAISITTLIGAYNRKH